MHSQMRTFVVDANTNPASYVEYWKEIAPQEGMHVSHDALGNIFYFIKKLTWGI